MKFILGKKVGMTSVIDDNGDFVPVTVILANPGFITQIKNKDKDGYMSFQAGFGERKKIKKSLEGHLKKVKNLKVKNLKEYRIENEEELKNLNLGDEIKVDIFKKGDKVKVAGNIKAKGFSGAVKRWGFKGGPASHGHPHQRRVGSIGSGYPQHVFKGKKMPGRKGPQRKTIINLEVFDIDKENNLLLIKGSVPGVKGRMVEIRG